MAVFDKLVYEVTLSHNKRQKTAVSTDTNKIVLALEHTALYKRFFLTTAQAME